jgi:hypothetical protein
MRAHLSATLYEINAVGVCVVNMHSHEQKAQLSGSIRNTESIDLRRRNLDIADDIGIGTFYVAGVHGPS